MPDHNSKPLSGKTLRSSKQRQSILDTFSQNASHLSAEEIYKIVKASQPNISLGTVYRNLEILTEIGTIIRLSFADGKSRYELASAGHHHHLVCIKCGEIENLAACPMVRDIEDFIENHDFKPLHHYFEIYGYCSKCH